MVSRQSLLLCVLGWFGTWGSWGVDSRVSHIVAETGPVRLFVGGIRILPLTYERPKSVIIAKEKGNEKMDRQR